MANKHLAARLARLRTAIGWSQQFICDQVNCDRKTLFNWENGIREIPAEILQWVEACAAALRVLPPPDYRTIRPAAGRPSKGNET
jgi:transcriptional regulator with XRE-family HTH domain